MAKSTHQTRLGRLGPPTWSIGLVLCQLALALEMKAAQMPFADYKRMLAGAAQFRGNRQAVSAREPLFYTEQQK